MKKYDPEGKCIKCGGGEIEDEWQDEITVPKIGLFAHASPHAERILRTCKNCGYGWQEGPLNEGPIEMFGDVEDMQEKTARLVTMASEIEIGDVVEWSSDLREYTVLAIHEEDVALEMPRGIFTTKLHLITLIRKGPKVHRFERVSTLNNVKDALSSIKKAGEHLYCFGPFTLTLTEEV
jgi:predicted nucleic-acid-binding Zn-ribbon protein